jgi:DMSO/TMAO reductase YedYZ heme-binding membrane subunit
MIISRKLTNGWPLLASTAAALVLMSAGILLYRPNIHGLHAVLRATARTSLVFFLTAFTASALWKLWPGAWSRWQLSNRRYLGLTFATSHTIHLMAIVSIALAEPRQFREDNDTFSLAIGALAYAFIIAMAATSFDRSANWLGARSWKILHTVGAYYIWLTFLIVLVSFAFDAPRYWFGVLILVAALFLRALARWSSPHRPMGPLPLASGCNPTADSARGESSGTVVAAK